MNIFRGARHFLPAICMIAIVGCTSAPTHWVDATGQSRPEYQFRQAVATCQSQALQFEQSLDQQIQPSAIASRNSAIASFIGQSLQVGLAHEEASQQYKLCLESAGWEQRDISTPSSPKTPAQLSNSRPYSKAWVAQVPDMTWRETPPGKIPDTLSFVSRSVLADHAGNFSAYVLMNYDEPTHILFVGTVQSVLFSVNFRCDTSDANATLIEFFPRKGADGMPVKTARNLSIHIKPNSTEDQMRNYVCMRA